LSTASLLSELSGDSTVNRKCTCTVVPTGNTWTRTAPDGNTWTSLDPTGVKFGVTPAGVKWQRTPTGVKFVLAA